MAALVLGILGIFSCQPLGIAAIIIGREAEQEIAASRGQLGGDSMAQIGVVLGWIAVGLLASAIVALVVVALALVIAAAA